MSRLRTAAATSRLARLAAIPSRTRIVARHDAAVALNSARWLVHSRELTNFTYDLTPRNRGHLAWWVSAITGASRSEIESYFGELESDSGLRSHIIQTTERHPRRRQADLEVRFGRRLAWYALVRVLKPDHVVETGTDKGLGSLTIASALLRNDRGRLTTIDVNRDSGYLIGGPYRSVIDHRIADSVVEIKQLPFDVDIFLHDSLHTYEHELAELRAVQPLLKPDGVALSDNSHETDALSDWAWGLGGKFLFCGEEPVNHWYPGAGVGAAWDFRAAR